MVFDVVQHVADAGPLCIVAEDVAPFDAAAVDGTVGVEQLLAVVEEAACVVVAGGVAVACAEVAENYNYQCHLKYLTL